jgi:hypothetical protein
MKTKHTASPLTVKPEQKWPFDLVTYDSNNNEVFRRNLPAYTSKDKTFKQALSGVNFETQDQDEVKKLNSKAYADEVLRATAPELLEQLIKVIEAVKDSSINVDHIAFSEELIKKATNT